MTNSRTISCAVCDVNVIDPEMKKTVVDNEYHEF